MNNHLGGVYYKDKISSIIQEHIGPKEKVLEVCCGCAIISKTILENNLAQDVTLSDIQDLSQEHDNFIQSDGLQNITDKYELIICSPPWYNLSSPPCGMLSEMPPILWQDINWKFHRQFYKEVSNNLIETGSLLITNCFDSRRPEEWVDMCNLTLKSTFIFESHTLKNNSVYPRNYILWWQKDKL